MHNKPHTEEAKRKMSIAKKGKLGHISWNKGNHLSVEHKKRISNSMKKIAVSKEWREKISLNRKGKKPYEMTKEIRNNIGMASKGRKHSEQTKQKMRIAQLGIKSKRWKGGYENKLMLNRKSRIVKRGNGGNHSLGDWEILKAQYNWTCPACKRIEPEIKLSEDHIVSLNKGGSDNIENIQPLCKSCNSKKSTKIIKYDN